MVFNVSVALSGSPLLEFFRCPSTLPIVDFSLSMTKIIIPLQNNKWSNTPMYMLCFLSINNLQVGANVVFQSTHVFSPLLNFGTMGWLCRAQTLGRADQNIQVRRNIRHPPSTQSLLSVGKTERVRGCSTKELFPIVHKQNYALAT
jgi:hypothetical protein